MALAHAVVVVVLLVGAAGDWVYSHSAQQSSSRAAQEATWPGLCATGKEQSPIDVDTSAVIPAPLAAISTHFDTTASYVKNTGHGFQLFETSPTAHNLVNGNLDTVAGQAKGYSFINGARFNFYQVHWHTPSENTIDGQSFAMEAHFVHQLDDAALHGTYHRLAVIALLYELGGDNECNAFLDQFWGAFPGSTGMAEYTGGQLDFNAKLTEELTHGYYHWYGSLTTPPCTEGVSWNLLKVREKVCQAQVDRLQAALANTQASIPFNNRVTQPLNHRVVADTSGVWSPGAQHLSPPAQAAPWLYAHQGQGSADAAAQAATWGGLCVTGHEQSPIDVVTSAAVPVPLAEITAHFDSTASFVRNTGHGFQLFETSPQTHVMDNGAAVVDSASGQTKGHATINGDLFNFYQVHWHTPSENTVDGQSFAMEAHFVFQLDDPALHGTYHRLAVIALLYELGGDDECNPFLDLLWAAFPMDKGISPFTGSFDLNTKLREELAQGYYHWYGSLTTPPCTEGVSWNLLKVREKVCVAQVLRLQTALATTQDGISFNNRVTQPLNHRRVSSSGSRLDTEAAAGSRVAPLGALLGVLLVTWASIA